MLIKVYIVLLQCLIFLAVVKAQADIDWTKKKTSKLWCQASSPFKIGKKTSKLGCEALSAYKIGKKAKHVFKNLTRAQLRRVGGAHNRSMFEGILDPLLVERVPGTPGNRAVRKFLISAMRDLHWHIETDEFVDVTPFGEVEFVNVIATQNPIAPRRLTLVCHYDSKYIDGEQFVGATDSAVPCAMMVHMARLLSSQLNDDSYRTGIAGNISLQFIFLDGEEAFLTWGSTDSIYGARHLAKKWSETLYPPDNKAGSTELDRMDVFFLLDLLGAANPRFYNWFAKTSRIYERLVDIEERLKKHRRRDGDGALTHAYSRPYFSTSLYYDIPYIQDDHVPFVERGVPVIHMISVPFPPGWHSSQDNKMNLDFNTIDNLNVILRIFVAEYLHLSI